jgi:A/G-specific adenine glycosylase
VASIAFRRKAPIVDGNVARVVARLFGIAEPAASQPLMRRAWSLAEQLVSECGDPREFNQGLMEIGALVCRPRDPECGACPLERHCTACASGNPAQFPLPRRRPAQRTLAIPLYLIEDRRGRILLRVETGPLMNGMYHLPHGDGSLLPRPSLAVEPGERAGSFRHTITNRRIVFTVWTAKLTSRLAEAAAEYRWLPVAAIDSVPHPSYVRKALEVSGRLMAPCRP